MAVSQISIITLDEAKQQLGLPQSDTSQDQYITGLINAAVSFLEQDTGRTLIDKSITERFYTDRCDKIITLFSDGVVFDNTDDTVSDGTLEVFYYDSDRVRQSYTCNATRGTSSTSFLQEVSVFPPEDGWRFGIGDTSYGTLHYVNLTLKGPSPDDIPAPIKQAALLIIDTLYNGSALDSIPENNAVRILITPYKKLVLG